MLIRREVFVLCGLMLITVLQIPAPVSAQDRSKSPLKFEVYQDASKDFRWRLLASADKDAKVLATGGQGYKAKADCVHGVKSIQDGAADKLNFEEYQDKEGEYRWRAKASNGQVVAASGSSYKSKADCDQAVDVIKKGAAKASEEEVKGS
jgi:uncharacterized protein YegP (UPF0339 family)